MTPEQLLQHHDQARLWGQAPGVVGGPDTAAAYQQALVVRQLRQQHRSGRWLQSRRLHLSIRLRLWHQLSQLSR